MSWIDPLRPLVRPMRQRVAAAKPTAATAPAPRRETDLEVLARWWRWWGLKRQSAQAAAERREEQDERERERRGDHAREFVLACIAQHGSWFPGDAIDAMREPEGRPRPPGGTRLVTVAALQ